MKRFRLVAVALLAVLPACRCGAPVPDYSEGVRVGRIEKISRKGVVWKSWEGYLVLQGFAHDEEGNPIRKTFEFSVLDADAPRVIPVLEKEQLSGGFVRLRYRQDLLQQTRYDSAYFVYAADEVTP